jgi:hypothetical protein
MASIIKKAINDKSKKGILDLVKYYESIEFGMEKNIYKWAILRKTGLTEGIFDEFIKDPKTFIKEKPQYFI